MSEIKVDTVAEKTSANGVTVDGLNIKDSKLVTANSVVETNLTDNIVTLAKMASGTDGNIISYDASGNPVAIATGNDGQVLTSTGAGSPPVFETIPGGGITSASQFRLTTSFDGDATPIASNLAEVNNDGYGRIGTAVSQSSGIFTFPSTGVWLIIFLVGGSEDGTVNYHTGCIDTTVNNSSYSSASCCDQNWSSSGAAYSSAECSFIFDVTNTTTHKVRFTIDSAGTSTTEGSGAVVSTGMTFIRLGDT